MLCQKIHLDAPHAISGNRAHETLPSAHCGGVIYFFGG
jgi:hypothetical protein